MIFISYFQGSPLFYLFGGSYTIHAHLLNCMAIDSYIIHVAMSRKRAQPSCADAKEAMGTVLSLLIWIFWMFHTTWHHSNSPKCSMLISVTETGCRWGILECWRQPCELCTFRRQSAQVSNNLPVQVFAVRWRTGGVSDKNKQGLVHVPFWRGTLT